MSQPRKCNGALRGAFSFVNIAIDYDDTYTRNPEMWELVIDTMRDHGCKVFCVTKRWESESEDISINAPVIYATRSKMEAVARSGVSIDIWIDDKPHTITPYSVTNRSRGRHK